MIPPYFAIMYHQLDREAMRYGWNVCLHGSLQRDLDMVLVPWTENAEPVDTVIDAFRVFVEGKANVTQRRKATEKRGARERTGLNHFHVTEKPHGRKAITMRIGHFGYELDISIIPRAQDR